LESIDFSKVNVEEILLFYNVKNIHKNGPEIMFSCPFPEHIRGDRNPSSSINTETGQWHCFSCGRSGNIISFISQYEKIPIVNAKNKLKSYGAEYKMSSGLRERVKEIATVNQPTRSFTKLPEEYLSTFQVDWESAFESYRRQVLPKALSIPFSRGLKHTILTEFSIGYDEHSRRITIPIRDSDGSLVGFKGRATKRSDIEVAKYLGVGDKSDENIYYGFKTVKTKNYVYGIDSADEYGIVVEGEFDTLWLRQLEFDGAVGLGGSNPSDSQVAQIINKFKRVTLLLDPDHAGKKAEIILVRKLLPYIPVKVGKLPGKDPNDCSLNEIAKAIHTSKNPLFDPKYNLQLHTTRS
jgi:DNA primase